MKYLKNRQEFLYKEIQIESINVSEQIKSSEMINEAFENDITWGGSLLGRLINSTIRKGKIYVQTARIGSVVKDIESELNTLVGKVYTDEKEKEQITTLQVRLLLTEIYKVVISEDTLDDKLTALIGDKSENSGLISLTIKEIEKLTNEQLEGKDELIEKLKRFRETLLAIDFNPKESTDDEDDNTSEEEGESSSESGDKDPNRIFYLQTFNLLKSIIDINRVIVEKRVVVNKIEVGKEYLDKNNKVCKVVSVDFEDEAKTKKLPEGTVSVIYRDEQKIFSNPARFKAKKLELRPYTKSDTVKAKTPKQTKPNQNPPSPGATSGSKEKVPTPNVNSGDSMASKSKLESFYYENESLPIYEEATEIKDNEVHARAAWNKISSAWTKCGIIKLVPIIEELVNIARKGYEQTKKDIKLIAKQLMANKATVGSKPLTFEELIKEAQDTQINNDIPKAIAVVSKYILALNEDLGLLASIGDANKPIRSFIESYKKIEEVFPKLKKEEPKKEEKTKESEDKKESFKVYDYSKFRIFEADDIEMEEEDEEGEETNEISDKVVEEWNKEFEKGEEKKWSVNEQEAKKLQNNIDEKAEKEVRVDANSFKDNIIRIVNLFGKAYKMYAVPVIPSGRPNGRISQKTFREYTYIGKATSDPAWSQDAAPSGGPWAANLPYEKFQNGIMKILEDTKYRKVLANVKFKNRGPNQEEGSGLTLFNFINDMLGEGGEGSEFRVLRHKLMKKYFEGVVDEEELEPIKLEPGKISKGERGEKDQLSFQSSQLSIGSSILTKSIKEGEIFKIKYKDKDNQQMYIMGIVIENNPPKKKLLIKFNISGSGKKGLLLPTYLKNKKVDPKIEVDNSSKLYAGSIDLNKYSILKKNETVTIVRNEIKSNNNFSEDEEFNITFNQFEFLAKVDENGKWTKYKLDEPDDKLAKDIQDERVKKHFKTKA